LPRLGPRREYKGLLEGFWGGSLSPQAFLQGLEELEGLRLAYLRHLPAEGLWVNPDCGLKTRRPEEALTNLRNMVRVAQRLRERWGSS
ncbi:MAG: hypothetical protein ACK4ZX_08025, partial [Thermus sp.]